MKKEEIVHYYDTCEVDYRLFWDLNHSHAMHAGYWDETTKTLRDALRRENEILAKIAKISPGDHVLDAGCGVGGSSIFLAKNCQCQVVGITLSEKQVQKAKHRAQTAGVSHLTSFQVMDYTTTTFKNESFDVVWGLESICHAPNKQAFIQEATRLLKPGGRLVVADGFASYPHYSNTDDDRLMKRWLKGWGVKDLETQETFESYLKKEELFNIEFKDITKNVWPSAKRLYWYSWPGIAFSKIGEWIGLRRSSQTENLFSARCQYQALKKGLWKYGIFYAEKNKRV